MRAGSKAVALLAAVLLALLVDAGPAAAALGDQGQVTLDKKANDLDAVTGLKPGDTISYTMRLGCNDNPCIDVTMADPLPAALAGFPITALTLSPPSAGTVALSGCSVGGTVVDPCTVNLALTAALGSLDGVPQVGLGAGASALVTLVLTVPPGLSPTWAYQGQAISNTATATATNSRPATDSAAVTVTVPETVGVHTTKSWQPAAQQYSPGATSTLTTSVANTSNVPAGSLVLQDPADAPDGATSLGGDNPFRRVDLSALCGASSLPAGATAVRVDAYVLQGDAWRWVTGTPAATPALPAGVAAGGVGGLRYTYTGDGASLDPAGAAGTQCLTVAQRDSDRVGGASLVDGWSTTNTAQGTVTVPGHDSATDTATAPFTVAGLSVAVQAGKSVSPDRIAAGQGFSVGLTGKNTSNGPLTTLVLTEPGADADPAWFGTRLRFTGFSGAQWPTGATSAQIVYRYADGSTGDPQDFSAGKPPAPSGSGTVTGFTVTYTGAIAAGATAGLTVTGAADPDLVSAGTTSTPFPDRLDVSGTNPAGTATATAGATLQVFSPTIAVRLDKTMRPDVASPGGTVVASLAATTGTPSAPTVNPTRIVVEDVWDGSTGSFWDAFDASTLTFTAVPAGATLTATYATGTPPALTWHDLSLQGTSTVTATIPVGAVGLRFEFDDPAGFAQGTTVTPNVVFTARSQLRTGGPTDQVDEGTQRPTEYPNAATTTATGTVPGTDRPISATADGTASAGVIVYPSGGLLAPVSKRWVTDDWSTDLSTLQSQSGSTARTAIGWGVTAPGASSVQITDALPGGESNPGGTVFDAFDLTGIRAVAFSTDPLLRWDTVSTVELYDSSAGLWRTVAPPVGGWMNGTGFVGLTLSTAQAATTTGVRVTVVPNDAARQASTEPGRPDPGSGVAWSAAARPFGLVWALRNTARSDGRWVTATAPLNTATPGVVRNDVAVTATVAGVTQRAEAADTVTLIDTPANVTAAKSATPARIVVPVDGQVDPADYPTVTFALSAQNTSPARAAAVRVADPCDASCRTAPSDQDADVFTGRSYDPATDPFERFAVTGISFSAPTGVPVDETASTVALWQRAADGTLSVKTTTMAAARTLTAAALAQVVGVSVVWTSTDPAVTGGLIPAGASLVTTLSTQLRATMRSTGEPVSAIPSLLNPMIAQSFDPVLNPTGTPYATPDATVELDAAALDVATAKTLTPARLLESQRTTPVTAALTANSAGSTAAASAVVLTDTDAAFFADFALTGLADVTLPAGADRVRVDLRVAGSWVTGTAGGTATLPSVADLTAVTGIRFTFDRADGGLFSHTLPPADWSTAAAFTVVLRAAVPFPTTETTVMDQVDAVASNPALPDATAAAGAGVVLAPGTPRLDVRKDTQDGRRQTEPGLSVPWLLQFTNVGDGYLDVVSLTDTLGPDLRWDGGAPTFSHSAGGTLPTTGVSVGQSDPTVLTFTFPAGSRLAPGETYTVLLGIVLQPGLTSGQRATNAFTVNAPDGFVFDSDACVNTSGNGQGVLTGVAANQCGTSNVIAPLTGALLLVDKAVKGSLPGATNVVDPALPCASADGFYRTVCVASTAVGGRDTWRLTATNTGTEPYSQLTLVDPLPTPGDRLLATGAPRGSQFRPVLDGARGLTVTAPAGATWTWQVTTTPSVCTGTGTESSWNDDPVCAGATWVDGATYGGAWTDVTGLRVVLDVSGETTRTLQPGESVQVLFDTVNVPLATADAVPVTAPVSTERAWNQPGAVAIVARTGATIARSPSASGVQVQGGSLQVRKTSSGPAAGFAPPTVGFDVSCTVPTGVGGGTAAVDLGAAAHLDVAVDGAASVVAGIPLGATCTVAESGPPGSHGEQTRTPDGPQTVQITSPATDPVPAAQSVVVDNHYDFAEEQLPVVLTKRVDTTATLGSVGPFVFHLVCTSALGAPALDTSVSLPTADGSMTWQASDGSVPAGGLCTVTETDSDGSSAIAFSGSGVTDHGDGSASFVAGSTAQVLATDTIGAGSLVVVKQRVGEFVDVAGQGPFVATVTCTWTHDGRTVPVALPDDGRLVLSSMTGYRGRIDGLRAGTVCAVVETVTGGGNPVQISPAGGVVTIPDASTGPASVTVTITNHFDSDVLAATGTDAAGAGLIGLLLLAGGLVLVVLRRRARA